jgi:hypothetical protein
MFVQHRDGLTQLCKEERPDINIGFELGNMAAWFGRFAQDMSEVLNKIERG